MTTMITGLTAERMLSIEAASIVDGDIVGNNLILTKHDGTTIDAGLVKVPAAVIPVVQALPSSPTGGDEIYFQTMAMAADGVFWHLRYTPLLPDGSTNTSAYKWVFLGGGSLYKAGTAVDWNTRSAANSSSNAYMDATAPTITIPLAGDYEIEGSVVGVNANATASAGMHIGLSTVVPTWTMGDSLSAIGTATVTTVPLSTQKRMTAIAAAAVLAMWYTNANTAGAVSFYNARMKIRPIRVG